MSLFFQYLLLSAIRLTYFKTNGHLFDLEENSACFLSDGGIGICRRLDICRSAREMLSRRERPLICSFDRTLPLLPVVCCKQEEGLGVFQNVLMQETNKLQPTTPNVLMQETDKLQTTTSFASTTPNLLKVTTERVLLKTDDLKENLSLSPVNAINISIEMCDRYHEFSYLLPPKPTEVSEDEGGVSQIFVVGGTDSKPKEFPHVALLGYGEGNDTQWLCGGALISENFILTAAHCLTSSELVPVSVVRLGDLDISSAQDDADPQQFGVNETFQHPLYDPSDKYHDVALLRLNASVNFNVYIKPACLHTERDLPNAQLVAAGWGQTAFAGDFATVLQKVDLNSTDYRNCSQTYTKRVNGLSRGLIEDLQICAHGSSEGGDTCQGDSGTPLQVLKKSDLLHTIVGITSFGINCGLVPGVYTRVSNYVPWIEGIVWPDITGQ